MHGQAPKCSTCGFNPCVCSAVELPPAPLTLHVLLGEYTEVDLMRAMETTIKHFLQQQAVQGEGRVVDTRGVARAVDWLQKKYGSVSLHWVGGPPQV